MDAKDHQSKNSKNAANKHPYNKNEKPNQSKKSISKSPQKIEKSHQKLEKKQSLQVQKVTAKGQESKPNARANHAGPEQGGKNTHSELPNVDDHMSCPTARK